MPILKLSSNYYWFLQCKHCIYNWKIYVSSAKTLTFDIKLFGRSFMYVKNRNGPKIDLCSTPALIISQWEFWLLSKTLWYLLSRKLWKSVSKLLETPIAFNLYMKPSCQTLSKPFDISKNLECLSKDGKLSKDP